MADGGGRVSFLCVCVLPKAVFYQNDSPHIEITWLHLGSVRYKEKNQKQSEVRRGTHEGVWEKFQWMNMIKT